MKNNKNIELDVDFIGGERALTKDEAKAISNYINANKSKPKSKPLTRTRVKHHVHQ